MSSITRFLPNNHVSYLIGKLVHLPLPQFIWTPLIKLFAESYKINLEEAVKPIDQYPSLGEFFVRRLKPGARPLGSTWNVHPADAMITQAGTITSGRLIQAKNKTYKLTELLGEDGRDQKAQEQIMSRYDGGAFLTYYLCPTDYHRVHSPVTGTIRKITHIPGRLWPVNQWSTENVPDLFSVNERVCVEIETDRGWVNVIFVGATNVGQIILSVDPEIRGNQFLLSKNLIKDSLNISIAKGEELGMFRMGSTVVMLYQKGTLDESVNLSAFINKPVRVNSDFRTE